MKILHISTSDAGGAAKACIRIHNALLEEDMDSTVLVLKRALYDNLKVVEFLDQPVGFSVRIVRFFKKIIQQRKQNKILLNKPKGFETFSFPESNHDVTEHYLFKEADIIHLHWVSNFVDYSSFFEKAKDKKIVWTLHDMNPFTGGCHYSSECYKFTLQCNGCFQLSIENSNYAETIRRNKQNSILKSKNIHIVAPSLWLLNLARKSAVFGSLNHSHIRNAFDTNTFQSRDRKKCRELFNIDENKKVILFIGDTQLKRKGFDILLNALNGIDQTNILFCTVGDRHNYINIKEFGFIKDEMLLSIIFSIADVFVMPSVEDNLPNTIIESLCCGTPVIGFPIGGVPELITNGINGILCHDINVESLREAIVDFLNNKYEFNRFEISQKSSELFGNHVIANEYRKIYLNTIFN